MTSRVGELVRERLRARWGLRTRIILWSVLPTLVIVAAVASVASATYYRVTAQLVMDRNHALTQLLARKLATDLVQFANLLDAAVQTTELRSGNPELMEAGLRRMVTSLRAFDAGVVALDREGRVVAADPRRSDVQGEDWSDSSFLASLDPSTMYPLVSDIELIGSERQPVVGVLLPLHDERRRPAGVLVGLFSLQPRLGGSGSDLYHTLGRLGQRSGSRLFIVDGQGRLIDVEQRGQVGIDVSSHPAIAAVLQGESGALLTRGTARTETIASYAPIPDTPWGLIEEEDWRTLVAPAEQSGRTILALLGLALLLPPLVVATRLRRITGPIADLTQAAQRMASGDLEQTLTLPGDPELAELAKAFNRMSLELQSLYAHLENKVAERTRELAALNAIAAVTSRSLDLEEVLSAALDKTLALGGHSAGVAYRTTADDADGASDAVTIGTGTMGIVAHSGLSPEIVAQIRDLGLADLYPAADQEHTAPVTVRAADMPAPALRSTLAAEGWDVAQLVPLVARDRLRGLMLLLAPEHGRRDPSRGLLAAIGQQVGMAMENAQLYARAEASAVAAERGRLARELHDSVSQTLFSANLIAGVLPLILEQDAAEGQARLAELHALTRGALAEMRALLLELRPAALAQTPFDELLRQLAEGLTGRTRLPVELRVDMSVAVSGEAKLGLYRIVQEALNNIAKHAQASGVWVTLEQQPSAGDSQVAGQTRADGGARAVLTVRDDGRGFDPTAIPAGHLGLGIMRERAEALGAELRVRSAPGRGTEICLTWAPNR